MASPAPAKATLYETGRINRLTQHDGTEHLAVNNTRIRRWLVRLALRTTGRFYKASAYVVPISSNLIVKRGPFVHLTEAATLQCIAAHTSIPVPRVWSAFVHRNIAYVVMERVRGRSLMEVFNSLSSADLRSILSDLRKMLAELRSLVPPTPGTAVQSCVKMSLTDSRIPHSNPRFGPFDTVQAFHAWLRQDFRPGSGDREGKPEGVEEAEWEAACKMVAMQDGPWPRTVFTHGDLNPSNILVEGGKVTGIIDWEFAGWYPHYWEYTSAWYGNRLWPEYQGLIKEFLEPCPKELEMEITRNKNWGDF